MPKGCADIVIIFTVEPTKPTIASTPIKTSMLVDFAGTATTDSSPPAKKFSVSKRSTGPKIGKKKMTDNNEYFKILYLTPYYAFNRDLIKKI